MPAKIVLVQACALRDGAARHAGLLEAVGVRLVDLELAAAHPACAVREVPAEGVAVGERGHAREHPRRADAREAPGEVDGIGVHARGGHVGRHGRGEFDGPGHLQAVDLRGRRAREQRVAAAEPLADARGETLGLRALRVGGQRRLQRGRREGSVLGVGRAPRRRAQATISSSRRMAAYAKDRSNSAAMAFVPPSVSVRVPVPVKCACSIVGRSVPVRATHCRSSHVNQPSLSWS